MWLLPTSCALWLPGRRLKSIIFPVSARHFGPGDSSGRGAPPGSIMGISRPGSKQKAETENQQGFGDSTSSHANFLHPFSMLRRAFSHAAKMSTYTTDKASPFTTAVVAAMRKLCVESRGPYIDWSADLFTADTLRNWPIRALTILAVSCSCPISVGALLTHRYSTVLLEAPFDPIRRQMNSVLLTIDLTKAVADEAIQRKDCVVVSYRDSTTPR